MDRAALDVALELGLPCGGWCPKGRRAEDGRIPDHYPMQEASSSDYPLRTQLNVEDSDGTLILSWGSPGGGTLLTLKLARRLHKPYFVVDLLRGGHARDVQEWGQAKKVRTLNVAGPREGEAPGIHARAVSFLTEILGGAPKECPRRTERLKRPIPQEDGSPASENGPGDDP